MTQIEFTIEQLRAKNISTSLNALLIVVTSFFVAAFLPQLLVQFVYASQPMLEAPVVLQYLPLGLFLIGSGYFVYAMISNLMRERQIAALMVELEKASALMMDCCGGNCGCEHDEMMMEEAPVKATKAAKKK